jgi:hypothetical protein
MGIVNNYFAASRKKVLTRRPDLSKICTTQPL